MRALLVILCSAAVLEKDALAAPIRAARTHGSLSIDGRLDEPAWLEAFPYSDFVENFPDEGAAPTKRTEVRVLYNDRFIYIGIIAYDREPSLILRGLGRRDSTPTSDLVEVAIDSTRSGRTAYYFSVNAAGVLRDAVYFGDVNSTDTWDAVWQGAAAARPDGWSAEIEIPLSILRFPAAPEQTWGIWVRRTIPRTHQLFESNLISRNANGFVSRFGDLIGLVNLKPKRDIELVPYLAARAVWRPQYSDPARPHPRLLDPSADVGLDLRASLFSDLTLTATINPDFGQVEAHQVVQNLSTFELFFPEKRPFFNQGLDIFQPVGAEFGTPHQLFYSRRIGLDAPILGAAKVTGAATRSLEVGLLDALVLGPVDTSRSPAAYFDSSQSDYYPRLTPYEAHPDRSFKFHWDRPFHFGPTDQLPAIRPVSANYFAGVARQQVAANSTIGATFTAATPLAQRCYPSDFLSQQDYESVDCHGRGGNAAALDWNLRTRDGAYVFLGQVDGSQQVGGSPSGRVFPDGTVLRPGDLGVGGYTRAGKIGGEPLRFDIGYRYASQKLDLNPSGFQPSQNQQAFELNLHFVRPRGWGKLHNFSIDLNWSSWFTTDGNWINRGNYGSIGGYVQLPGYEWVRLTLQWEDPRFDVREITNAGVPYQRRPDWALILFAGSDPNQPFSINGDLYGFRTLPAGPVPVQNGYGVDATAIWRPTPRLETQLIGSFSEKPQGARYIETVSDGTFIFGAQNPGALSLTLRQQLVITPTLTLQAYAQLFSQNQHFFSFYQASSIKHAPIRLDDLKPVSYSKNPDVHSSALNLNLVLRWEYRLGSTLFLVYSRSQQELPIPTDVAPPVSVWPWRLFAGPAIDTFLVKWSYWWNL